MRRTANVLALLALLAGGCHIRDIEAITVDAQSVDARSIDACPMTPDDCDGVDDDCDGTIDEDCPAPVTAYPAELAPTR